RPARADPGGRAARRREAGGPARLSAPLAVRGRRLLPGRRPRRAGRAIAPHRARLPGLSRPVGLRPGRWGLRPHPTLGFAPRSGSQRERGGGRGRLDDYRGGALRLPTAGAAARDRIVLDVRVEPVAVAQPAPQLVERRVLDLPRPAAGGADEVV